MKKMTCAVMGGPCDEMITGATKEEMMANGMAHIEAMHPELAEKIKAMSEEEMAGWKETFDKTWEETPDEAEEVSEDAATEPAADEVKEVEMI